MKKLVGAALICAMTASLISGCAPTATGTAETSAQALSSMFVLAEMRPSLFCLYLN